MNESKFLGVSILISAVLVASALCYHASKTGPRAEEESGRTSPRAEEENGKTNPDKEEANGIGRYQFHPSNPPGVIWVIDTVTGKVTSRSG